MMENYKNEQDYLGFISKLKPPTAKKSKAIVWAELEQIIEMPLQPQAKIRPIFAQKWAVAASFTLLVLLGGVATLRLYTKTVNCLPGMQQTAYLPDGSVVKLNAQSVLSYQPFWFKINRTLNLEGEAFFEVKKGEKFTVQSQNGNTTVVGTSFNIYARNKDYEVTCITGKVKVQAKVSKQNVLITPNQKVTLGTNGNLNAVLNVNTKLSTDWMNGQFIFTQTHLDKVFAEIARRYGVTILNKTNINQLYTGNFTKTKNIETALDLICKTFNAEYKKLPSGEFVVQAAP